MNTRQLLAGGVIAAVASVGGLAVTTGVASAWTGGVTVGQPTCVGQVKRVHVVVANHEPTPAMMQTSDDVQATIAGNGTQDFLETTKGQTIHVRLTWFAPDGVTRLDKWDTDVTIPKAGSEDCVPPTTEPVTTVPEPTTAPATTAPPTTVKLCEDGKPPSIPVEDGSLVCPEFGAPTQQPTTTAAPAIVRQAPPRAPQAEAPVTTAGQLPTTGSSSTIVIVAGVGALLVGAILLVTGRRGQPS